MNGVCVCLCVCLSLCVCVGGCGWVWMGVDGRCSAAIHCPLTSAGHTPQIQYIRHYRPAVHGILSLMLLCWVGLADVVRHVC